MRERERTRDIADSNQTGLRLFHPVQTLVLPFIFNVKSSFFITQTVPRKTVIFQLDGQNGGKTGFVHTSNYPLQRSRGSQIIRKIFFADFCVQNNFAEFISRALICQTWAKILLSCTMVYIENSRYVFVQFMVGTALHV